MDQIPLVILFNRMTSLPNIAQIAKFVGQVKHYTSDQPSQIARCIPVTLIPHL